MTDLAVQSLCSAQPVRGQSVRVECASTLAEVEALRETWNAVQDAAPDKHVLMDHRWMTAWWRRFGAGKQLHVLVLRRDGRVIGLAPMMLSRGWEAWPARDTIIKIADDYRFVSSMRWRRWAPIRRVGFLVDIASHNVRNHLLLLEHDEAVYDAVLHYWAERRRSWDVMMFEGLPVASGQVEAVQAAARRAGLSVLPHGTERTYFASNLPATMDAFMKTRTRHFRRRIKAEIRTNHREGTLDFRCYRGEEMEAGIEILFRLEAASWKANGDPRKLVRISLDEELRGFFRDVALAFARTDQAQVVVLRCDGEPAIGLLTLERQNTALTMVIYHDQRFTGRLTSAPVYHHVIEQSITRGVTHLDFHGNTLNVGKWANTGLKYRRVYVFSGGLYSRLLAESKRVATAASRRLKRLANTPKGDG